MAKIDPQGHYTALNVSPGASRQEIRLAYELLKQARKRGNRGLDVGKIEAAYEVLGDLQRRRQYDESNARSRKRGPSRLHSVPLLLGLAVIFLGILWIAFAPRIRAHLVSFDVGDDLYWRSTHKALGEVVEVDVHHEFPEGAPLPAYRVQPASGTEPMWLSARDLNANCVVRD